MNDLSPELKSVIRQAEELIRLVQIDEAFEKFESKTKLAPEVRKRAEELQRAIAPYRKIETPYKTHEMQPEESTVNFVATTKAYDYSAALNFLKEGVRMRRSGWNGKGMYIVHQKGYPNGVPINKNTAQATGIPEGTTCRFLPYIMMKTADPHLDYRGTFVPWLASQTDLLAEDWEVAS